MKMDRRSLLSLMIAASALPASARARLLDGAVPKVEFGKATPFSRDSVVAMARTLAQSSFEQGAAVPDAWQKLTYDQYRGINFRPESAVWRDTGTPFEMEMFSPGLYFPVPIEIFVVDNDQARPALFSKDVFRFNAVVPDLPDDDKLGYSGLRLRTNINSAEHKDEFLVFQGASYFRAVARDQSYGLSARGLALNTGDAQGEEFPEFQRFWVESPAEESGTIRIHALLNSPSVTGAYTFDISPGDHTEMDIQASLFPRTDLSHVGIAAGTSMFLFDETNRQRFSDFRQAVHDSDGLLIQNGAGETLWRQLANPLALQVSSFVDDSPRGFGLMQRPRNFEDYSDLEANYHKRPGLWVTPGEDWGRGAVTLVEIPADKEIYDNIVAYWRPREPLKAGSQHTFNYRLTWCDEAPLPRRLARVESTRAGRDPFTGRHLMVIDFAGASGLPEKIDDIFAHVSAPGGNVSKPVVQRIPSSKGIRVSFNFDPEDRSAMEMRSQLMVAGRNASEVWLYRWTADS